MQFRFVHSSEWLRWYTSLSAKINKNLTLGYSQGQGYSYLEKS